MNQVILRERLGSLERQLRLVEGTPDFISQSNLARHQHVKELHGSLDSTIGKSARKHQLEVESIVAQLNRAESEADAQRAETLVENAWRRYLRLYQESQEIFAECLEFVGGLAIRTNRYDDEICQIADELIRSCATESTGTAWFSLTVPAAPDALAKTLARMVRLRFPDWTIWTLPFTAHEYGHVVISEQPELNYFVMDLASNRTAERLGEVLGRVDTAELERQLDASEHAQLERELYNLAHDSLRDWQAGRRDPAEDSGYGQRLSAFLQDVGAMPLAVAVRAGTRDLASVELQRANVLVADAFATYTMGPAYSCAALLLNFLPARPIRAASDAERAHVVLQTLTRMSEGGDNTYQDVIRQVSDGWQRVVSGPGTAVPLEKAQIDELDRLVDDVWRHFAIELRPGARFEHAQESDGWLAAQRVSLDWRKTLRENPAGALETQDLGLTRLRDVLNAAWYCRLLSFRDGEAMGGGAAFRASGAKVEAAAKAVSTEIIATRERQSQRRSRSNRRPARRPGRAA